MAISEVTICNSALVKIGVDRIISLNDDVRQAKICKEQYSKVLNELLCSHPWNFAIGRASLAALVTAPAFGYLYQYQLPADYNRALEFNENLYEWAVESGCIVTDAGYAQLRYIKKDVPTYLFTSLFAEALSCKLAHDISYVLVQSVTLKDQLYKEYESKLRQARSFDAQEGTGQRVATTYWANSRR